VELRKAAEGLVLKRNVDIVVGLLLLVVAAPILVVAGILIKMDSAGSVFFFQDRMGRGFRPFQLFKLRTMLAGSEGPEYTLGEDARITRVGRWLRWLKFDELPQLWNVVRGDMSLVGPRPVIPALAIEFREAYAVLLAVRPGLTDPATMKYCRESDLLALVPDPLGYFKAVLTPNKLRLSAAYMERATVWADLRILAGTALALFPLKRSMADEAPGKKVGERVI
jgi:lipopolysaccharide/colanic/teichoic acid biosynthesis glycosyltransferase